MIINLHGFKGNGSSEKSELLEKRFGKDFVYSPDLPFSPKEAIKLINDFIVNNKQYPHILIGTSLGGFYAYYLYNKHDIPTFLINPSFTPWINLSKEIGIQKTYDTNIEFEWKSDYVKDLIGLDCNISYFDNFHSLLNMYLGENDDVINHSFLKDEFPYSKKIWTDDNHRMSVENFKKFVIPDIKKYLSKK